MTIVRLPPPACVHSRGTKINTLAGYHLSSLPFDSTLIYELKMANTLLSPGVHDSREDFKGGREGEHVQNGIGGGGKVCVCVCWGGKGGDWEETMET